MILFLATKKELMCCESVFMDRTHLNSDLTELASNCAEVSSEVSGEYHSFHFLQ